MPISTVNQKGLDAPLTLTSPTLSGTTTATTITSPASTALTLQTNNGTTGLNITAAGQITIPLQPAFSAYRDESLNNFAVGTSSGSPNIVPFAGTTVNTGSCFSTSTNRFTAPVAGRYMFLASICWTTNGNERWAAINFQKNGAGAVGGSTYMGMVNMPYSTYGSTTYASSSGSVIVTLAANDYIQVGAFSSSGTALVWQLGCFFSGYLLG
jgi:hypothetical protein